MNCSNTLKAVFMLALMAGPAMAQPTAPTPGSLMPMKPGTSMQPTPVLNASPSTQDFKAADKRMMKAMSRPMRGDTDQDFVAGMLPHHAGAVNMAKVELRYGKDPEMLKLAHSIIVAQDKEIVQMRNWQARHPEH